MPILDPDRNLAAWLDRAFNAFTQHYLHTGSLYNHTHDPEGLLSTLPSIANTLIGSLTALWLNRVRTITEPGAPFKAVSSPWAGSAATSITATRFLTGLFLTGLLSLTAGLVWSYWFPINKNLWTSSYVLFAAGWSLLLLALCYGFIDIRGLNAKPGRALLWPWLVFGSNAITAYVVSNFLVELALWIKVPSSPMRDPDVPSSPITAWLWVYRHFFAVHNSTEVSSLAFALAFTALCFLPNWLLWRKKIFLKV